MPDTGADIRAFWRNCRPAGLVDLASGAHLDATGFAAAVRALAAGLPQAPCRILIRSAAPIRTLTALFAVWQCGGTAVLADAGYPESAVSAFCDRLGIAAAIGEAGVETLGRAPGSDDGEAPALLLATSGTGGVPKWVALSHAALIARVEANIGLIGCEALMRVFVPLPLSFGHGLIGNALTGMAAGGRLFFDPSGAIGHMRLGETLAAHGIGFLSSVPSLWEAVTRTCPPPDLTAPLRIHVGSAPLSPDLAARIRDWAGPSARLFNCYGITECANWIAAAEVDAGYRPGDVGRPFGARLAIRAEDGTIRQTGEGEVLVAGPSLMTGYADAPAEALAPIEQGWFRTGDRGRIGPDGRLHLGPRIKDLINVGGIKVDPSEVETALARYPGVATAVGFAVPDRASGEAVAVVVVPAPGAPPDANALRAHLRATTRRAAWPVRIEFADAIPLTPRGKISRGMLREHLVTESEETWATS